MKFVWQDNSDVLLDAGKHLDFPKDDLIFNTLAVLLAAGMPISKRLVLREVPALYCVLFRVSEAFTFAARQRQLDANRQIGEIAKP